MTTTLSSVQSVDELVRGRVVAGGRLYPDGVVAISGTSVVSVGHAADWAGQRQLPVLSTNTVIPGLVDVHCHGGGGYGFPEADRAGCEIAAEHHRRMGTTTMLASLVSAPAPTLLAQLEVLVPMVQEGKLAGIHLEGPFLSVLRCGAQDPANIVDGDPHLLETLLEAGHGTIRSMTVAPETPRFADLHRILRAYDAVPSIGHTDASGPQATRGIVDAAHGPLSATHLFNGMAPLHHRAPGPVAACLAAAARGQMVVELIADGVHLADETVSTVFDLIGAQRIALISDAMAAAGMPDGRYPLGPLEVDVADGIARLAADGDDPDRGPTAIAGSTSRLIDVLAHSVAGGVDLIDAVTAATHTPATLIGRGEDLGDLAPGYQADLVVLDDNLQPNAVMSRGQWVYRSATAADGNSTGTDHHHEEN
ncbi:MAG: amidohydrolase family protein [Gordonia sp. (in: high G+C Gram-positive bacteria)]